MPLRCGLERNPSGGGCWGFRAWDALPLKLAALQQELAYPPDSNPYQGLLLGGPLGSGVTTSHVHGSFRLKWVALLPCQRGHSRWISIPLPKLAVGFEAGCSLRMMVVLLRMMRMMALMMLPMRMDCYCWQTCGPGKFLTQKTAVDVSSGRWPQSPSYGFRV